MGYKNRPENEDGPGSVSLLPFCSSGKLAIVMPPETPCLLEVQAESGNVSLHDDLENVIDSESIDKATAR